MFEIKNIKITVISPDIYALNQSHCVKKQDFIPEVRLCDFASRLFFLINILLTTVRRFFHAERIVLQRPYFIVFNFMILWCGTNDAINIPPEELNVVLCNFFMSANNFCYCCVYIQNKINCLLELSFLIA